MQKLTPFLWFEKGAKEAVEFYTSLFSDSKILTKMDFDESVPDAANTMMYTFELFGQTFQAINGGPVQGFTFTSAISFLVVCDTQEEIDRYWNALLEGGKAQQCGWLTDRFGITWQIAPRSLDIMMSDSDHEKRKRVTEAMMKMIKLDLPTLEKAYRGE